ncbi:MULTISPECIES: integrating conjugative element protein [unclassified Methylophaga]|uniref:integrating conjugative element protein n=1 Tax=unclassified Methylophaga TaxID=2629249 RepID=UPI0025EB19F0|nr:MULTISPECIES: integrating conjugative element protein [unclassified Methylophaga]
MKLKYLAITTALICSGNSYAYNLQIPDSNAAWYYGVGGQRAMTAPASPITNSIILGGSLDWGSGFNCSAFDPTLGIANTLNQVKSGADAIQQQVTDAATGAIASLPLLMLQRANPGLYELLMNSMARAEQGVRVSTQSCQQMQQTISQGGSPFEGWIDISRTQDWQGQMGGGGYRTASVDVVQAQQNVEKNNGDNGVTWVGGTKAGGRGQRPIDIPSDIVKAGYNQSLNRDANSNAIAPQNGSRVSELWESPEELMSFSRSLLGEEKVRTYSDRPTETMPARGMSFEINKEVERLTPIFDDLINGNLEMSGDNLLSISTPSVVITSGTIQALRKLSPAEQNILKGRLIQEVATARVIEMSLMLLRLLFSGAQEPNVSQNGPAQEAAQKYSARLQQSIDDTLFEHEMNKRLAAATSQTIKDVEAMKVRVGNSTSNPTPRTNLPNDTISSEND